MGVALGLAITVGLAFLRKTVTCEDDLKNLTNIKSLGSIPSIRVKRRTAGAKGAASVLDEKVSEVLDSPLRGILVPVLRSPVNGEGGRVILVTSTVPNEGKSTVSFNLAACLAKSGKRVILVDGDMRHQSIKTRFGTTDPSAGLLELSRASKPDVSRILIGVQNSSLKLLAGNSGQDAPTEFLGTDKMRSVIRQCRDLADVVIIDAPPASGLADAAVLSRLSDQIIYVIRHDMGLSGAGSRYHPKPLRSWRGDQRLCAELCSCQKRQEWLRIWLRLRLWLRLWLRQIPQKQKCRIMQQTGSGVPEPVFATYFFTCILYKMML